jgi:hypothetical protein
LTKRRKIQTQSIIIMIYYCLLTTATVLVNGAMAGTLLEPTHNAGAVEAAEAL